MNEEKVFDYSPVFLEEENTVPAEPIHMSQDLKRQLDLDKLYKDYNWYVENAVDRLVDSFDLNERIRNKIRNYIKSNNPKDNYDSIDLFVQYFERNNPPIMSSEVWDVLTNFKVKREGGIKAFKDRVFSSRNYDWYISKVLLEFNHFELFTKIKEMYDKYVKVYPMSIPENLIKFLCYLELKKIKCKECTIKNIGITGTTLKKYRKRFKELGL
jgi:hypothetical protein